MTSTEPRIDVIILAGGRGERMGGQDKGWVRFGTTCFIEATLSAFEATLIRPIISANRNLDRYRELVAHDGGLVVQDQAPGFNGPLSGLVAAAMHLRSPWVFVVPCDTPQLKPLFHERLSHAAATDPTADGFMASDGQRTQPLHCLLKRTVLQQLPEFLATPRDRQPGMRGWTSHFDMREVDYGDQPEMFENFNTPEVLEAFRCVGTRFRD